MALLEFVSSLLDGADFANRAIDAKRLSDARTSAPPWRMVGWSWLLLGATGVALWARFPQFSAALPTLALSAGVAWIICLLIVLLMTGAAVELWLVRRRALAEFHEPVAPRKSRKPRSSRRRS